MYVNIQTLYEFIYNTSMTNYSSIEMKYESSAFQLKILMQMMNIVRSNENNAIGDLISLKFIFLIAKKTTTYSE